MTNFSEKGHAKNVANLGTMISFATGFGADYNPSKKSISLAALNSFREEAGRNLVQVNTHYANWRVAVEEQQALFDRLNNHLTRIVSAVENSEVPPAVITTAKALNKKLRGTTTRKPKTPAIGAGEAAPETQPKSYSASRLSQDSRIENLEKLVQLLTEQPGYAPNEPDLQVTFLQKLLADFKVKNEAVKNCWMTLSNARISRNKTFYNTENGLVKLAADVKRYVKSVYGGNAPQFEQVSRLIFTRIRH